MTYQEATHIVINKLCGKPITEAQLNQALSEYPEIGEKLVKDLSQVDAPRKSTPPSVEMQEIPEWSKAGLRRLSGSD